MQWSAKALSRLVKIFDSKTPDQLVAIYGIPFADIRRAYMSQVMIMSKTEIVEKHGRKNKRYTLTIYAPGVARFADTSVCYKDLEKVDHLL